MKGPHHARRSAERSSQVVSSQGQRPRVRSLPRPESLPRKWGSPESFEAYERFKLQWQADRARASLPQAEPEEPFTVLELCWAYFQYAEGYYRKHGRPTRSLDNVKLAIRAVKGPYGHEPVAAFGRATFLQSRRIWRPRAQPGPTSTSKSASSSGCSSGESAAELVPPAVHHGPFGRRGFADGAEHGQGIDGRGAGPDDVIDATLPHLPPVVADMVRFERLTGCRPGEVCMIRPCDVDRSGEVWQYRPESHKTEHHGRERIIYIGPQAQEVLRPYLLREAQAHCFQPAESERKRRAEMRARRLDPAELWQCPATNRKARPARTPKTTYDRNTYAQAVRRAVEKANAKRRKEAAEAGDEKPVLLPHWHPNQLRHTKATEVRRRFGLEAPR